MNRVCDLIYDISCKIGEFYSNNKVLGSEEEKSRILLLEATRRIMKTCFDLIGMKYIERI
jgi:arginyl-tRNA synthetase